MIDRKWLKRWWSLIVATVITGAITSAVVWVTVQNMGYVGLKNGKLLIGDIEQVGENAYRVEAGSWGIYYDAYYTGELPPYVTSGSWVNVQYWVQDGAIDHIIEFQGATGAPSVWPTMPLIIVVLIILGALAVLVWKKMV